MIDLHSHILPGLDDGARSFAVAEEMVRIAAGAGTTDLVATPHASFEYEFDPAVAQARLDELQAAAGPQVRLHRGCELYLSPRHIEEVLAAPSRFTICGKRYLLVEFPEILIAPTTVRDFERLLAAGVTPVIAHPERNFLLHARAGELKHWIGLGCLVQVTAQSLQGRFGRPVRRFSRELLERDLVHFVASDAHDARDRGPRLDDAYREVAARCGESRAQRLFVSNPRAVLAGDPLPPPDPEESRPRRKWFFRRSR